MASELSAQKLRFARSGHPSVCALPDNYVVICLIMSSEDNLNERVVSLTDSSDESDTDNQQKMETETPSTVRELETFSLVHNLVFTISD